MVLPTPRKGEKQNDFISRCVSTLTERGEGQDQKQRVAICFTQWRRAKGEKRRMEQINIMPLGAVDSTTSAIKIESLPLAAHPAGERCPKHGQPGHENCPSHDHSHDEDEEKKVKKGKRIIETEDNFIFPFAENFNQFSFHRKVEDGVIAFMKEDSEFVGALVFKKPDFNFEQVRQWLIEDGWEPSSEQRVEFEDRNTHKVMLEVDIPVDEEQVKFNETVINGQTLLVLKAVAIAPGTWKGFVFSNDVISPAVKLYKGVNVVEHHHFEEPADVKGWILSAEEDGRGIIATAALHNEQSIAKVKNKKLHSVSSNFLLDVDDDKNVTNISKVIELTLTDKPAVKDAVIVESEERSIEFDGVSDISALTNEIDLLLGSKIEQVKGISGEDRRKIARTLVRLYGQFDKEPPDGLKRLAGSKLEQDLPPILEVIGGKTLSEETTETSISLEAEMQSLRAQLAESKEDLAKRDSLLEQVKTQLERQERASLERTCEVKLTELQRKGQILPTQTDHVKKLWLGLNDEGRQIFEEMLSFNAQVPQGEQGHTEQEKPQAELSAEELEEIKTGALIEYWDAAESGGSISFGDKPLFAAGDEEIPLPTGNGPVTHDEHGNAYIGGI